MSSSPTCTEPPTGDKMTVHEKACWVHIHTQDSLSWLTRRWVSSGVAGPERLSCRLIPLIPLTCLPTALALVLGGFPYCGTLAKGVREPEMTKCGTIFWCLKVWDPPVCSLFRTPFLQGQFCALVPRLGRQEREDCRRKNVLKLCCQRPNSSSLAFSYVSWDARRGDTLIPETVELPAGVLTWPCCAR
jgi:hypothetical protein